MLEDPWADLMMADNSVSNDSLMPQVGDSLIDPAPDVPDNLESNTEDLSAYSYNEPVEEATDRATSIDHNNDDVDKDINVMSDSMIPQVGDSILVFWAFALAHGAKIALSPGTHRIKNLPLSFFHLSP